MKIYAFIPTRDNVASPTLQHLIYYLSSLKIDVRLLINQKSIFEAYENEFNSINPEDDDIIIMCHDDIEILMDKEVFLDELIKGLSIKSGGFVGVAGTQKLTKSAVWWEHRSHLKGFAFHGKSRYDMFPTPFGGLFEPVVVLDGVFLAARAKTIKTIGLKKPKEFSGDWDFYDLEYTMRAYEAGLTNYVVPILIRHESPGELVGRESWAKNRIVFSNLHYLPVEIKQK